MTALMLHRLGRIESAKAYSESLAKLKRDHAEAPHMLRGMAMLLARRRRAVCGRSIPARSDPALRAKSRAGAAVERDNSMDFHKWTCIAHKTDLARALGRSRGKPGAPRYPESFVPPENRAALLDCAARVSGAFLRRQAARGTGGQGIAIIHAR
jgi:hypothetical protein